MLFFVFILLITKLIAFLMDALLEGKYSLNNLDSFKIISAFAILNNIFSIRFLKLINSLSTYLLIKCGYFL